MQRRAMKEQMKKLLSLRVGVCLPKRVEPLSPFWAAFARSSSNRYENRESKKTLCGKPPAPNTPFKLKQIRGSTKRDPSQGDSIVKGLQSPRKPERRLRRKGLHWTSEQNIWLWLNIKRSESKPQVLVHVSTCQGSILVPVFSVTAIYKNVRFFVNGVFAA